MAKLMKKHGDDTPIHYDEALFNANPSIYQIIEDEPVKPAKAKAAKVDVASGDFDLDI